MAALSPDVLLRVLRENPGIRSADLYARLGGISRPTLARHVKALGEAVVVAGSASRTRYAARRPLRGNPASLPLFRIDENGKGHEAGSLTLAHPRGSGLAFNGPFPWPLDGAMRDGWFDGLPYPLHDMRPQGFLGRNFAHNHATALGVSRNPEEWTEDDIVFVLATNGHDLPGNLVLGEEAYRRLIDSRVRDGNRYLPDADVGDAYAELAERALRHGDIGSSAGGEFPKFTARRVLDGRPVDVIVKFSGNDDSAAVRRWSDLLVCEHLALRTLQEHLNIEAAESAIFRHKGRTFLEVVRFDRHGESGRSAVCTLQSLDAALLGLGSAPWPVAAAVLEKAGWLAPEHRERISLMWWFGQLIANSDMHTGNLAFRPGLGLAPAYDMLPMQYAPLRGGELPAQPYAPRLPLPGEARVWEQAADGAIAYWQRCSEDARVSGAFRQVCQDNAGALSSFRAKL